MPSIFAFVADKETPPPVSPPEVRFEGFGSIAAASIALRPLTILVGKNNTGKSYAAALLWAIRSLAQVNDQLDESDRLKAPSWFREFVNRVAAQKEGVAKIEAGSVLPHLNRWLSRNKNSIVSNLMSVEDSTIGKLSISFSGVLYLSYMEKMPKEFKFASKMGEQTVWRFSWKEERSKRPTAYAAGITSGAEFDIADRLFVMAVENFISSSISHFFGSATYIPAARTGLMLSIVYSSATLVGNLALSSKSATQGRFSLPTLRFLQRLLADNEWHERMRFGEIADFLEESILAGKLTKSGTRSPTYSYVPSNSEKSLPMHAVSSMVSELSPILAILRGGSIEDGLILEEPEAHLHLSAQRCMARAIARLVNSGIPVVLTTHSDTFLQQINLLIQLGSLPKRKSVLERFGYEKNEILSFDGAECYEFIAGDGGTTATKSAKSSMGFVVSSLNEALINLSTEALELGAAHE